MYASSTVGHEDAPSQVLPREGWGWQRCQSPAMPGAMLLSQKPEGDRSPQPSKGACRRPGSLQSSRDIAVRQGEQRASG